MFVDCEAVVCIPDAPVPVKDVVLAEVMYSDEMVVLVVDAPRELLSSEAPDKSSGGLTSASCLITANLNELSPVRLALGEFIQISDRPSGRIVLFDALDAIGQSHPGSFGPGTIF